MLVLVFIATLLLTKKSGDSMYKNFSLKVKLSLLVGAALAILIIILGIIYSNGSKVEKTA